MISIIQKNAQALNLELNWLAKVIDTSLKLYFGEQSEYKSIFDIVPPDISKDDSFYAEVIKRDQTNIPERVVLLLALAPHVKPHILDVFLIRDAKLDKLYTEFGGVKQVDYTGFLPTGETAAFLLGVNNLENRFELFNMFCDNHYFSQRNILKILKPKNGEPYLSGALILSLEYLSYLSVGVSKFTALH